MDSLIFHGEFATYLSRPFRDVTFNDPYCGSYPVDVIGYYYHGRSMYYIYEIPFTERLNGAHHSYFDLGPNWLIADGFNDADF